MTRGIRLEPKIDITYTVRDLTLESAPIVQEVLGRAFADAVGLDDGDVCGDICQHLSQTGAKYRMVISD